MTAVARVWVAMSGGVDSSTAAALLVAAGHDVTGVTMRLVDDDASCSGAATDAVRDARSVCDLLGVPHEVLDLRPEFKARVVTPFCEEYAAGRTPNPCVECNERLKFGVLLDRALEAGADHLATGHYARVARDGTGTPWLARGVDRDKDQSYFLYRLGREQLERVLFPIGESRKAEVRAFAASHGLPSASRAESQEACFLVGADARSFVRERLPSAFVAGPFVDESGAVAGSHDGAVGFTVGQRQGLGLATGRRLHVASIEAGEGVVQVRERADLWTRVVTARDAVWRGAAGDVRVTARARYRGPGTPATAVADGKTLTVTFDEPVWAVAPGQSVVCWAGDVVVGGGKVSEAR